MYVLSDLVRVILCRWFGHDDLVMMEELHQARSCVIRCLGLFVIFVVVVWDDVWSGTSVCVEGAISSAASLLVVLIVVEGRMSRTAIRRPVVTI